MLNAVALLIPVFLLLVFVEWYISYKRGDERYTSGNLAMNLTIGAIDQIGSLLYFAALYFVMQYVYNHFRLFEFSSGWYQWIGGYIAVDFLSYWYHRFSHRINILWAGHVTHHSSELFNFSNGFRTSLFQGVNRIAFWALLPVFGFSPVALVIILKVSGIYDFLLHTEYIPKLGFLEKIFITPSHHRVHHGKNDIYIDKNYGSTFVIWDKMFGTFQEETEKVQYGILSNYTDNDPLHAISHHYQYLWNTMKAVQSWPQKIKLLFMPPEWKPKNAVANNSIVRKSAQISPQLRQYAYFQISCSATGVIAMLAYKDFLSITEIILYSLLNLFIMRNVTRILNNNIHPDYEKQELNRMLFALTFTFLSVFLIHSPVIWLLLFFLLISVTLLATTQIASEKINNTD